MCSIISNCRWNILFVENVIKKSTWGCLCLSAAAAGFYITKTCCIIFLFILRRCLQENWIKEAHCNKNQNTLHRLQQSGNRKFSFFVVLNKWKTLKSSINLHHREILLIAKNIKNLTLISLFCRACDRNHWGWRSVYK